MSLTWTGSLVGKGLPFIPETGRLVPASAQACLVSLQLALVG